jgi:hypothetical protein
LRTVEAMTLEYCINSQKISALFHCLCVAPRLSAARPSPAPV